MPGKIYIGSKINDAANHPAKRNPGNAANHAHSARFREEKPAYVNIARAQGLHDSDFASPFKNCHYQRIHDTDGSNGEREAAEDSQEDVENGKELAHIAGLIDERKCVESHFLDGVFDGDYLTGIFHPHAKRSVSGACC